MSIINFNLKSHIAVWNCLIVIMSTLIALRPTVCMCRQKQSERQIAQAGSKTTTHKQATGFLVSLGAAGAAYI